MAEEKRHHARYLALLSVSMARDRQLDLTGSILEDRQPGPDGRQESGGFRLPQLEHTPHVAVVEGAFDGDFSRGEAGDDFRQGVVDVGKA